MPPLTTYARVHHRPGFSDKDVNSSHVEEFIEDAQAFIEAEANRTFAVTDSDYKLARGACTDLAAAYTIVHALGGAYSGLQSNEDELNITAQQRSKLKLVNTLFSRAEKAIDILRPHKKTALIPKASTGE